jgi:hypothetical protein
MKEQIIFALAILEDMQAREFITKDSFRAYLHELFLDSCEKAKKDPSFIEAVVLINNLLNKN